MPEPAKKDDLNQIVSLDVTKLDTKQRAAFLKEITAAGIPGKEVISVDASQLSARQRQALSKRLIEIARGTAFDPNISETLVGAESSHSSHTDNDGWI